MAGFDVFKDKFSKQEKEEKSTEAIETVDMDKVERIVNQMKQKYKDQGILVEEDNKKVAGLRGMVTGENQLEVQKVEDLKSSDNKLVSIFGGIFVALGAIFNPLNNSIANLSAAKQLSYYLYSANMKYSVKQWLALATVASGIVAILAFLFSFLAVAFLGFPPLMIPLLVLAGFMMTLTLMFLIPKQKASARGRAISLELPFALRHIATQLSAGIGLYRTLQTVASADYGVLSEEFSRTITEIEEGTDTKLALRHLSLRTQSKALRNALMHIIRALKTGGNLSDIMNEIAEDVAFELRLKMKDFSEKMNFLGVLFIMMAIVLPVFIAILGGIRNAPLQNGESIFQSLPLTIEIMTVIYLLVMPMLLGWMFVFIYLIQPHV